MQFQSSILSNAINTQTKPVSQSKMLVHDTEPIISIDPDLRKIIIPKILRDIAVEGDHLSETIYFHMPRYFDGNDLSKRTCLIRFINAGNEYGESDVVNIEVFDDYIKFGWAIDNYASRYSGILKFTVQFETVKNGIEYQWQTAPAELNILAGLNIKSTITNKDDILFRTLTSQIQDINDTLRSLEIQINAIPDLKSEINKLSEDVKYLKNNVVYALTE